MVSTVNIALAMLVVDGNAGLLWKAVVVLCSTTLGSWQQLLLPSQTFEWA